MSHFPFIIAAAEETFVKKTSALEQHLGNRDILLISAIGVLIAFVLVVCVGVFRKRGQARKHPEPIRREIVTEADDEEGGHRVKRRRRRRRRDHRPRNATLHDTGGLPPPRAEDQPPSY